MSNLLKFLIIISFNLIIRIIALSIGAGGAIVALSNIEDEFKEFLLKTKSLILSVLRLKKVIPEHTDGNCIEVVCDKSNSRGDSKKVYIKIKNVS
jgi:hypothetical protein